MIACQLLIQSKFLQQGEVSTLTSAFPTWRLGSIFGDYNVEPLVPVNRRRYKGFGRRTAHRSTAHDTLSVQLIFHYAWIYLDPHSRYRCTQALPTMRMYATYTRFAGLHRNQIRTRLQAPRPPLTQDNCYSAHRNGH
jgi:hypothetical protein